MKGEKQPCLEKGKSTFAKALQEEIVCGELGSCRGAMNGKKVEW